MTETIDGVLDRMETNHQRRVNRMSGDLDIGPNGLSIDLLRAVYRDPGQDLHIRMRAAMACLKHEVPSLGISVVVNDDDIATRLDRALARIAATNNQNVVNGTATITEPTFQPEPQPQPTLRNPLNRVYSSRFRRRV
jgi:hypothetical protein